MDRPLTVREYRALETRGVLDDLRTELVAGRLRAEEPRTLRQGHLTACLGTVLASLETPKLRRYVRAAVVLSPVDALTPDLYLARSDTRADDYLRADEVVLTVEIADPFPHRDLGPKRREYAHAEIPEYWVVSVAEERVHVFRDPEGGDYRTERVYGRGETFRSHLSDVEYRTDDLLP